MRFSVHHLNRGFLLGPPQNHRGFLLGGRPKIGGFYSVHRGFLLGGRPKIGGFYSEVISHGGFYSEVETKKTKFFKDL